LKIAQDAICEALDVNDSRVVDIHLVKRIDPLRPHIEVELEAIPDWGFDSEDVYLGKGHGQRAWAGTPSRRLGYQGASRSQTPAAGGY
jgi:hypothetical protein